MIQMQLGNESKANASQLSLYRPYGIIIYDVITGHRATYIHNSSQKKGRAMGEVSLCLSCQCTSTDMQYDQLGSFIRSGHLAWPDTSY